MIHLPIKELDKYKDAKKLLELGYAFIKDTDVASLPLGKITIATGVEATLQEHQTAPASEKLFETHDKFFDIQFMVSGQELFGFARREELTVNKPYDPAKDITFYNEPANSGYVLLKTDEIIVVSPDEAHKPCCCLDNNPQLVKKLIIKVAVGKFRV
ncbi:hypothetical protein RsTz2092_09190 [Deferribacterales bacterium RsTz2092]|nr:hypothetical protein AGMMS49941_07060 [Deferribacterales bacterium]